MVKSVIYNDRYNKYGTLLLYITVDIDVAIELNGTGSVKKI